MESVITTKAVSKKLDRFFKHYPTATYKAGDVIIQPAETIDTISYVTKGCVRAYTLSKDGQELTLHIARARSYFPIMFALASLPNRYYWQAVSPVSVQKAPLKDVLAFVEQDPAILLDLTKRFAGGICGLLLRIEDLTFKSSHEKVVSILSYLEKTYNGHDKLTHSDLAAWTGLTRETVTRQMQIFKKK